MGLLRANATCWRAPSAGRVKLLVDCQDYYRTLLHVLATARRSVHLLGWSFDPRTEMTPDAAAVNPIGAALIALAQGNPALDVRLLAWRSALPISATQEFFPHRAKAWFKDSPVRFELDDAVPFGACHHQKVVVIDDSLALIGGADIACDRWDTPAHLDEDPRRRTPSGGTHGPRHEVMAMVDGPVAAELGDLFRDRWRTSVGDDPVRAEPRREAWPKEIAPDLVDAPLAIARTSPPWRGRHRISEIAELTLAAIAEAKSLIYIENQYFTWPMAVEALARRLAEPDGPEIVLVCSEASPSYFDRITMDRARSTALWRLKSSDVFGRFHALAPHAPGGRMVIAHAKLMIFDDRLARISSANLNNRSHGFDTECELAVEADAPEHRAALSAWRDRLAGHWVGRDGAAVTDMRRLTGSLAQGLWALDGGRRLRPLEARRLGLLGEFIADFHLGDPTGVADSWRPWLRRERLLVAARRLRLGLAPD